MVMCHNYRGYHFLKNLVTPRSVKCESKKLNLVVRVGLKKKDMPGLTMTRFITCSPYDFLLANLAPTVGL